MAVLFWIASFQFRADARKHGVTYRHLFMHLSGAELAELAQFIEFGSLQPVIDREP